MLNGSWLLTFELQTVPLLVHHKVIPYTSFEHFGIICFWIMLQTNKQTDKQTVLPMPTDIVGVGNNNISWQWSLTLKSRPATYS